LFAARFSLLALDSWPATIADVDAFSVLEPLCVLPPDTKQDAQPNIPDPTEQHANNPTDEPDEGAEYPSEPVLEPDREPDIFDNEEEYVGINDESMYMPVLPHQNTNNAPDATNIPSAPCVNADAFGGGAAQGGDPLEAEVDDADPLEVQVIHDPENPNIVQGARFPDIVSFRKAIRHYAVKKGFEFGKLQTDPTRFIAKCKAAGCPWRIHASRIWDGKTIEVKLILCQIFIAN
jgi:hypothetical protein